MAKISLYDYIADNNPWGAQQVIRKYGYQFTRSANQKDLGKYLRQVVFENSEPALRDVLELHPDREILMEIYMPKKEAFSNADGMGDAGGACNCNRCRNQHRYEMPYYNATGPAAVAGNNGQGLSIASVSIIAAALFLSTAILMKNH